MSVAIIVINWFDHFIYHYSDSLSSALSAFYAKIVIIAGIGVPVTEILTSRIPSYMYQSFYVYLYALSILFVIFIYTAHIRTRAVFSLIKSYRKYSHWFSIAFAEPLYFNPLCSCICGVDRRENGRWLFGKEKISTFWKFLFTCGSNFIWYRDHGILWPRIWTIFWAEPSVIPPFLWYKNENYSARNLFSSFLFRRYQLFNRDDCAHANRPNDIEHHSNAVYIFEYNRLRYGTTQSDITIWINAHGGDKHMWMALCACGRDQTWNSTFEIIEIRFTSIQHNFIERNNAWMCFDFSF